MHNITVAAINVLIDASGDDLLQVEQMLLGEANHYVVATQTQPKTRAVSTFSARPPRPHLIENVVCLDRTMLELC